MTELLRIYKELYAPKEEYCVICFRSSNERRMVSTKSLELFIKSVNLPFSYVKTFQKLCYVCERAAAAAHRLSLAAKVSGSIHQLFYKLRTRGALERFTHQIQGDKSEEETAGRAREWAESVAGVRARSQLLQTEVLLVSSLADEQSVSEVSEANDEVERPGACADMYVVPDAAPARGDHAGGTGDALSEPEIYMETVMLDEDESDPIEIKDEVTLAEPLPPHPLSRPHAPSQSHLTQTHAPTRPPALSQPHPLSQTQPLTQPHLTQPHASTKGLQPTIVPIETLLKTPNTSYILHPIVESNGVITVPSLAAQIVNGQLVTVEKSNIMIQIPKLALHDGVDFNLVTDPGEVKKVLKGMRGADVSNVAILSDEIPANMESNALQMMNMQVNQLQSNNMQEKNLYNALMGSNVQPVYRKTNVQTIPDKSFVNNNQTQIVIGEVTSVSDRKRQKRAKGGQSERDAVAGRGGDKRETDWEDKIPMDVISFMDATDPNAEPVLSTRPPPPPPPPPPLVSAPLGRITNVHTVRDENVHSAPEKVHSAPEKVHSPADSSRAQKNKNSSHTKDTLSATKSVQSCNRNIRPVIRNTRPVIGNVWPLGRMVSENNHQNVYSESVKSVKTQIVRVYSDSNKKVIKAQPDCDIIDLS